MTTWTGSEDVREPAARTVNAPEGHIVADRSPPDSKQETKYGNEVAGPVLDRIRSPHPTSMSRHGGMGAGQFGGHQPIITVGHRQTRAPLQASVNAGSAQAEAVTSV
jgi:hypothetical protein